MDYSTGKPLFHFQLWKTLKVQNLIFLVKDVLQAPGLSEARGILLELPKKKGFNSWTDEETDAAKKACGAYNTTGILVRNRIVPKDIILENWGASIKGCYEAAEKLIAEENKKYKIYKEKRWDSFKWLAGQVK